jgi:6-phosphogluconolactonase
MSSEPELRRLITPQQLYQTAADEILRAAKEAVEQRGRFTIALSGGSTPKGLYTLIAANAATSLPWEKMFFFFGDERHVLPDHPDSNFRVAEETLLSKVPVPGSNVFRIPAEASDAALAADAYEKTLHDFFSLKPGEIPRFDVILLGLGPDGHTASLFPETAALLEKSRLVVANWVEKLKGWRITLTLPVLNAARMAAFLVSGTDKAAILHEVLEGKGADEKYPARLVRPVSGQLIWFVDRAAASDLASAA